MLCLFGYLVFMVVYKWFAYTSADSRVAPFIIILFIEMFTFSKSPDNAPLYEGQVCAGFVCFAKREHVRGLICASSQLPGRVGISFGLLLQCDSRIIDD